MSGYLLDTHAALWWWTDQHHLGPMAASVLDDAADQIFVSVVSAFEIAYKWRAGKLPTLGDPRVSFAPLMRRNGFRDLPVMPAHAMLAGTLDGRHRDPFDRLIAAQALIEDMTVVTKDAAIATFGCKVLW